MLVTIIDNATGKSRAVDRRSADILVTLKKARWPADDALNKASIIRRDMTEADFSLQSPASNHYSTRHMQAESELGRKNQNEIDTLDLRPN